eukprot:TRINITY_DN11201_c0_g1_i1.p1 TRINITY_DN11201_c0_g1~~TRINITY_DN11201_c0_g1_i1.p1  ORF type:complete len:303 (-),score=86.19 TRINITY_DN11201_c0_g1_i1:171-1079(-)
MTDSTTLRSAQLELRTHTQLMPTPTTSNNNSAVEGGSTPLRSWLISVQTLMSGNPVNIASVASSIEVVVPPVTSADKRAESTAGEQQTAAQLEVEYLGQMNGSVAIYRLEEVGKPTCDTILANEVKIKLVPRFSSEVYNFYMLDDLLHTLVGKKYLLHPKYVISLVLAYARQHQLLTDKFIICDSFLSTLFGGVQWLKIRALWSQILKLISPMSAQPLYSTVNLGCDVRDEPCKPTESKLDVSLGESSELYPGDWFQPSDASRKLKRTESSPCLSSKSSKSPSSSSTSTQSSKRTLRRHKTL